LRQVLRALPADLRFCITELRLDQNGVLLEGQARNHAEAQMLAQNLRQGGVLVESPKTERTTGDSVSFVISGPLDRRAAVSAGGEDSETETAKPAQQPERPAMTSATTAPAVLPDTDADDDAEDDDEDVSDEDQSGDLLDLSAKNGESSPGEVPMTQPAAVNTVPKPVKSWNRTERR
jgi:hypothetical protein